MPQMLLDVGAEFLNDIRQQVGSHHQSKLFRAVKP